MKKMIYMLVVLEVLISYTLLTNPINHKGQHNGIEKYVSYNGYKVHYKLYGSKSSGKTLVFVHGWSSLPLCGV